MGSISSYSKLWVRTMDASRFYCIVTEKWPLVALSSHGPLRVPLFQYSRPTVDLFYCDICFMHCMFKFYSYTSVDCFLLRPISLQTVLQ